MNEKTNTQTIAFEFLSDPLKLHARQPNNIDVPKYIETMTSPLTVAQVAISFRWKKGSSANIGAQYFRILR